MNDGEDDKAVVETEGGLGWKRAAPWRVLRGPDQME